MKKLANKFRDERFKVIYININDNIGRAETMANKIGLEGVLLYLNREQSAEVRKLFDIRGIPHYVLIDKNGTIIENDAPHPGSGEEINESIKGIL